MPVYISVFNTAMHEQVSFEKINPKSIEEALQYREQLKREFQQGCHEVKLFVELCPEDDEEDIDIEEEADMEEIEEETEEE